MQATPPTIPAQLCHAPEQPRKPVITKDVTEEFMTLLRAKARSLTNRGGIRAETLAKELGVPYTSARNWVYGRSSPTPWAAKILLAKLKRITTAP